VQAPRRWQDGSKGIQRTRKRSTVHAPWMREQGEGTLHGVLPWRRTAGAEPDAMQAARPVLNGGDEETGLLRPRLVATQLRRSHFRQQVSASVRLRAVEVLAKLRWLIGFSVITVGHRLRASYPAGIRRRARHVLSVAHSPAGLRSKRQGELLHSSGVVRLQSSLPILKRYSPPRSA